MGESVKLPGFRFHPTEEELLNFYLKGMVYGKKMSGDVIGFLNIYNYDPTELPRMAKIGEREWYFFVPRERKHGSGGRPNRTTDNGFWKATGSDREIVSVSDPKKTLGLRKTLVFYQGRAPRGRKTHWIMNEYRLPNRTTEHCKDKLQDIVLCKIYMKATSLKVLEQKAAATATADSPSFCSFERELDRTVVADAVEDTTSKGGRPCCSHPNILAELQLPKLPMDWTQDSFWTQFSPWLDNFTPFLPMC